MAIEIPTSPVFMVGCTNTGNFGDVMMYDTQSGAYMGNFPNGPGEYNSVYFQNPSAITPGLRSNRPAAFVSCVGYTTPSISNAPKLMYFMTDDFEYGILTWLPKPYGSYSGNGLCYAGGSLYLLQNDGSVLRYDANTGQAAGLGNTPGDATFLPAGTITWNTYSGSQGIACSPETIGGNLYIVSGDEILIFSLSGNQTGSIQYSGFAPGVLSFNGAGLLYVMDQSGNILRFNGATGVPFGANGSSTDATLIPAGTAGLNASGGMCVVDWADGTSVYLTGKPAEGSGGSVWQYDGATGAFEQVLVPNGSGGLANPVCIQVGLAEVPYPPPPEPPPGPPSGPIPPWPVWRYPWPRKPLLRKS